MANWIKEVKNKLRKYFKNMLRKYFARSKLKLTSIDICVLKRCIKDPNWKCNQSSWEKAKESNQKHRTTFTFDEKIKERLKL